MSSFKTAAGTELPLLDMRGKPYLQVAHRLVWFREEKPDWSIETELLHFDAESAIAKATIRDDKSRVIATAHKTENKQGFADFIEKAETGAVGRALAECGYGTQFAPELDEGDRVVDSPVSRPTAPIKDRFSPKGFPQVGAGPVCCGQPMQVSRYVDKAMGSVPPFYCPSCKKKQSREAA